MPNPVRIEPPQSPITLGNRQMASQQLATCYKRRLSNSSSNSTLTSASNLSTPQPKCSSIGRGNVFARVPESNMKYSVSRDLFSDDSVDDISTCTSTYTVEDRDVKTEKIMNDGPYISEYYEPGKFYFHFFIILDSCCLCTVLVLMKFLK